MPCIISVIESFFAVIINRLIQYYIPSIGHPCSDLMMVGIEITSSFLGPLANDDKTLVSSAGVGYKMVLCSKAVPRVIEGKFPDLVILACTLRAF